jgi:hypothetical protein
MGGGKKLLAVRDGRSDDEIVAGGGREGEAVVDRLHGRKH